ncbi:ABC transporter ATP-binding protein [Enterovirga rhinocerotis]|uniref:Putative spermidine/putrescine transport system ATP-binding protein n=1 Tax=Enterovirga rhinocerotis TaxID=1339210 RepID=A0A4R7BWE3_9HYPH|nr:ABC transporter ATP-binding protein [Enterovirga rhinocerotis]TDR90218.1 putative spermidine/putrescine transport system ATP-binding protein [Enterovirga rhinocerotis]
MSSPREHDGLHLRSIHKSFGAVRAVDGVDLTIAAGEFVAFLGPSGCGKTTLLRIIAGFDRADSGELLLDGRDIGSLQPNRRDVGLVFQNLALFPHLSVAENVGFGMRMRGRPDQEIRAKVAEMLEIVDLSSFGDRRIPQLSGGQKQRVALARALVLRPAVLLLDEPLSALDAKLRRQLQSDLKALQRETATTFVFVTHDQEEALSMADRVAVFNRGRLEQVGEPEALYARPQTRFVAEFVGDANLLGADDLARFSVGGGADELLIVRPEQCAIGEAAAGLPVQRDAVVTMREFVGPHARLRLEVEGSGVRWLALCPGVAATGLDAGARTRLGFDPSACAKVRA